MELQPDTIVPVPPNRVKFFGTTGKMLMSIPHWRVVGKDGKLLSRFSGGLEAHADHLKQESFVIDTSAKVPKVQGFKDFLTALAQYQRQRPA
ncbi:MAG: MGMT family protein [Anaerolineae bacterium]|nr:MGMT family protein [Anaerolineae bacterium]